MGDIDEIRDILGFAPYRGAPVDWEAAAQALGASVPDDFRALVDAAGPGKIGRDTLLLQPFAADADYDQVRRQEKRLRDLKIIWEDEAEDPPEERTKPPALDEPGVRLVVWAASGLGFYLYWVVRDGTAPSSWEIAVEPARGGQWEFLPGTGTNLLLRLLRGEVVTQYLSTLADTEQHFFTPAES